MSEIKTYPPAIELFRSQTRRQLVRFAIETTDDEWYTKQDLADAIDVSRESVRKQFSQDNVLYTLVEMGIFDVSDPDVKMPRYKVADSDVIDQLREYEDTGGYPLDELLKYSARQDMVVFFLEEAGNESHSRNAISEKTGTHYSSVQNHIEELVDAEIVREVEGTRSTEYEVTNSRTVRFILALNRLLVEQIESS